MDNFDTGNPTYCGVKSKPGLHSKRLVSKCLSHGTSVQLFLGCTVVSIFRKDRRRNELISNERNGSPAAVR